MRGNRIVIIRNAKSYDFGGGERFPVFLADTLRNNNWHPIIVSRSPKLLAFANDYTIETIRGWWWSKQNWNGKYVLLFPIYLAWQFILTIWYVSIFIRFRPEVVHIQSKDDFIAATVAGRIMGCRVIWTDHADLKHIWKNVRIWYKNPVGKLVYLVAYFANSITLVSKSEKLLATANLSAKSRLKNKLIVIYNGVSDRIKDYKKPGKTDEEVISFCVASRLVIDKGIGEVIEAFNQLSIRHPHTKLVIMGDGPDAEIFKKSAIANKNITLVGHQSDPLRFIAECDIFIQPTYHEGFSVALVEASMLGKAIIATSVGGNIEIIKNHKTGLLVPAKDTYKLYSAMNQLIENSALRKKIAKNARLQYEERFNFDDIVIHSFVPLYEKEK